METAGLDGRRSQQKLSQSDKSGQLSKGTCWPGVGLQDHGGAAGGGRVVQCLERHRGCRESGEMGEAVLKEATIKLQADLHSAYGGRPRHLREVR